tara:strand:+ start:107 stop:655 length:549 start_codon:yes stop_codon:yes gene_type:complete
MRFFSSFKLIPFLTILIAILAFGFTNQKQSSQLKILIWKTPSLSLGTYLAVSSASGFILSFLITSKIASLKQTNINQKIQYKDEKETDYPIENTDKSFNYIYENTLIERDLKDPSPTINASFRVIGKSNANSQRIYNNKQYNPANLSDFSDDLLDNEPSISNNFNKDYKTVNDWNDESYLNW